jgi:hypothetical protein
MDSKMVARAPRLLLSWDGLGMMASIFCAVHCLLLPIALTLLSAASVGASGMWSEEWVHHIFAGTAVLAAAFGLGGGYRHHGNHAVVALGALGSTLLILAATLISNETSETIFTLVGAAILSVAHFKNWSAVNVACHCSKAQ